MESGTVGEQIGLLRELTRSTGVLHEAQVQQIRYWPVLLFSGKSSAEVATETKKSVKWTKPSQILADWTKTLLGDDWTVLVQVGKAKPQIFAANTKDREAD
jgi:hypothetical protein